MATTVSIIGTAGRGSDGPRMSQALFEAMRGVVVAELALRGHGSRDVALRSGGAAWADHVAVDLFLAPPASCGPFESLTLCLPAFFRGNVLNEASPAFYDTGARDWIENPGGTANYYHRLFSAKLRRDTLAELAAALRGGALVLYKHGFQPRNILTGQCDLLIAFTWAPGAVPKDGGTKHCWDHSTAKEKLHVPLAPLAAGLVPP